VDRCGPAGRLIIGCLAIRECCLGLAGATGTVMKGYLLESPGDETKDKQVLEIKLKEV